ncbi:hypothetical protein ABZU75_42865 [Streptosporangium sp. NPDC005286]|uniref:hypothetical protein n=1 Tax=Streptosporangium sp. NPDC005286 TaxID=3154463 RepID=UPI0033A28800
MATTSIGWTLPVPSSPSLAALITALELQVRVVEEPYLIRTHASITGRFVPALGRLSPAIS